jgi:hypothetical protein
MPYYSIEPEVAGVLGASTMISWRDGTMHVDKLHYEFHGWLGDHILESVPCHIASAQLAKDAVEGELTG